MKKNISVLALIMPFFALNAQDFSTIQNALDLYSVPIKTGNAKFSSMAGANGALGGDAMSMLTNPAGIGVAITDQLSVTLSQNNTKHSSAFSGNTIDAKLDHFNLANSSAVFVLPNDDNSKFKFINFGINYSSKKVNSDVLTNGRNSITFAQNTTTGADLAIFDGHNYSRTGTQSELNLGIGVNYKNSLYWGAALNLHRLDLEQWDEARFFLENNNTAIYSNNQYTPYREEASGLSGNIGVIGKISKEFRLGLAVETPIFWSIDRVFNYSGLNGTRIDSEDRAEDRKMRTPMKATLSAAFVPNKNFALNVDYSLGITQPYYSVYGPAETELNDLFKNNGANASQVRIGTEYRLNAWRLRGGYAYTGAGLKTISFSHYRPDNSVAMINGSNLLQGDRQQLGLGVGYDISSFSIDLGYQNVMQKYHNVFLGGAYWESTLNSTHNTLTDSPIIPTANGISEVKQNFNNFYLTLGFRF